MTAGTNLMSKASHKRTMLLNRNAIHWTARLNSQLKTYGIKSLENDVEFEKIAFPRCFEGVNGSVHNSDKLVGASLLVQTSFEV